MQSEELRLWNFQVLANLLRERVVNFLMARNGRGLARSAVDVHTVTAAFPQELDAVTFEVTDRVDPFHDRFMI